MKHLQYVLPVIFAILIASCSPANKTTQMTYDDQQMVGTATSPAPSDAPSYKYEYETVPGDPLNTMIYTLDNGMKVYMSINKKEPRVQTSIAVRTGSRNDPPSATGLAHYLEHMLFKGTSNIGTSNWEAEKVLLQQISDLYEQHRGETDPAKRKAIYNEIDKVSGEAAKLAIANEYDKMVASLGARGTNAYTSLDQTVYINDIPSNSIEKWMSLESERFSELVLRLFHTELEAVYEEFNIGQDSDGRKLSKALLEGLFPTHTYGTQSTIGKGEHLKNPSHVLIHEYFDKYYVPNNMAICVAGDLNPDQVVDLAKKYFGDYKQQEVTPPSFPKQPALTAPVVKTVFGQEEEMVDFAFRVDNGAHSDEMIMIEMIDGLLTNGKAGIVDLNLLQKQKVLSATSWFWSLDEYGMFGIEGKPRDGQTLDQVKDLLFAQLDALKRGEFEEWQIEAVIKSKKLQQMRGMEYNNMRTGVMVDAFITDTDYGTVARKFDRMEKITKQQIIDYANKRFDNGYVLVYKKQGEDPNVYKVEKPTITPVAVNRESKSGFIQDFMKKETKPLSPEFIDFNSRIQKSKLANGVPVSYIENDVNKTFSLYYVLDMGRNHDKVLPLAVDYLEYLGTDKYSAEELKKEFFKLGLDFGVSTGEDRVYVSLSGLNESFEEGVKLFEHILANAKADDKALEGLVADIMKQREAAKSDKRTILRTAMFNYARHGKNSPFLDRLDEKQLKQLTGTQLTDLIKSLTSYKHSIFYYGTQPASSVRATLDRYHKVPVVRKDYPAEKKYAELETPSDKIIFVNFDMVQAEMMMVSKGQQGFRIEEALASNLYNNYFGFGLSSIMFQEIRESKALAYSTWAYYSTPNRQDKSSYMRSYVGTQVDKLPEAMKAVRTIIEDMPVSDAQIEAAKNSLIAQYESERITGDNIYWTAQSNKRLGFDRDIRKDYYEAIKGMTKADLIKFQNENVKGRGYTILVLGDKKKVDMDFLKTLGPVQELTLEEVFGY